MAVSVTISDLDLVAMLIAGVFLAGLFDTITGNTGSSRRERSEPREPMGQRVELRIAKMGVWRATLGLVAAILILAAVLTWAATVLFHIRT